MKMISIVAMAAFIVSGTSKAEDVAAAKPLAPQQTAAAGQAGDQSEQVGAPAQTSGKIISMHTVSMAGMPTAQVLVKIQTEQGDTDIVDLGTVADLKSSGIEPREGQQLWVSGRVGRINDKELIVAENLSESKLVTITRTAPLREESEKHAAARNEGKDATVGKDGKDAKTVSVDAGMQVRTIDGTVIHTRNMKIEGEQEEHVLAKLQTENGIVVVDLGTTSTMPKVNLSEGQSVAATGYVGHLNNKPIIVADSVGNLANIQRPLGSEAGAEIAKNPVQEK